MRPRLCSFVKPDDLPCRAVALSGYSRCFAHQRQLRRQLARRTPAVRLGSLADRRSILRAFNRVFQAIASDTIPEVRAMVYLQRIRLAVNSTVRPQTCPPSGTALAAAWLPTAGVWRCSPEAVATEATPEAANPAKTSRLETMVILILPLLGIYRVWTVQRDWQAFSDPPVAVTGSTQRTFDDIYFRHVYASWLPCGEGSIPSRRDFISPCLAVPRGCKRTICPESQLQLDAYRAPGFGPESPCWLGGTAAILRMATGCRRSCATRCHAVSLSNPGGFFGRRVGTGARRRLGFRANGEP